MARRIHLLLLAALVSALLPAAPVSGVVHGARRHLAVADGVGSEHRRLLGVVERRARGAVAAGRWSATVRKGGGHGHGRGHGRGRGHGAPETPAMYYPRTVAGSANYHHGRSGAAATGPARPLLVALAAVAAVLLLRL
ncbi:hypothetical protein PVAP13_2KG131216 [Panicum virgatum]|uniref:Shadow of prion protein n=1 Tax=Panicum virgatum TaxID=38727 RepID=A0A8T0W0J2_PANVG|nr:hypothetical protein PVAP13_2KG131216 [Panicum virgatum]